MTRLGLCCLFRDQPIKFVTTTATAIGKMKRPDALAKLSRLCMENADALLAALQFCADNGIGCFRVNSQILPIKTHPTCGYEVDDLPEHDEIIRRFKACGRFVKKHKLRTCFHPDQFVVMNSPRPDVVEKSVQELDYQAEVAEWIGADVINIHGGGAYGDKPKALTDFARNLERLSARVRSRLTVENDDKIFTPADLLPICKATSIPLVYDVHHHRCNPDGLSIEQATKKALATWDREPMFHISSPIEGWKGPKPERHHDFIDVEDFPACWQRKKITVEVEAKAKEVAVAKLMTELKNREPDETWFVYIMRCADNTLYTGITNDVPRRFGQHNAGTASRYTRSRLPVALVYQEVQASRSDALKRELAIKALSRREKEALMNTVESVAESRNQRQNVMAKIPSSKFPKAKKKIASRKFPTAKRKLSSGKLASQTAKIPSRKFAKAKKATKKVVNEPAPLGHPTGEQARQETVAILNSRTDGLKAVKGQKAGLTLKHPLPSTPAQWLKEIKLAVADACEAKPISRVIGTPVTDFNLYQLAPHVCLKFRGLKRTGPEAKRVVEVALANYIVNSNPEGIDHDLEQRPVMAFTLCYVAAHLALDLLDEQQAETVLIYCEERLEEE